MFYVGFGLHAQSITYLPATRNHVPIDKKIQVTANTKKKTKIVLLTSEYYSIIFINIILNTTKFTNENFNIKLNLHQKHFT